MKKLAVSWDLETELIGPSNLAPRPVCMTWQTPGQPPQIVHRTGIEALMRRWLEDPTVVLVGAHVAFDFAVLIEHFPALKQLIFKAYDEDRVTDVLIRQKLLDLAAGKFRGFVTPSGFYIPIEYNLEKTAKRCAGIELQKDAWRLSYAEFMDVPLERWIERAREVQAAAKVKLALAEAKLAASKKPEKTLQKEITGLREMISSAPEQALKYPLEDARATLASWEAQEKHSSYLADQYRQCRAGLSLYLTSAWGLRTDERGVAILRADTLARLEENEADLIEAGLVRPNGVRNTKAAKALMIRICKDGAWDIRRTDGHDVTGEKNKCKDVNGQKLEPGHPDCAEHVSLDKDACEAVAEHPLGWQLVAYAELSTDKKVLSNDVVALEGGIVWPIHTRFDLAETGRATSSKPNIMNWAKGRKCRACNGKGEVDEQAA